MKFLTTGIITLILTIISLTKINAQERDYLITNKGDTIFRKISLPFLGSPSYKETDSSRETIKIKPDSVKEYFVARKNLLQRSVHKPDNDKPMFFHVIEKGKIYLYEVVYNNNRTSTTLWYVSKGDDIVQEIKTSDWFVLGKSKKARKDVLAGMLYDNKEVYNKFVADDSFSFDQIRNLVHLYNTGQSITAEPESTDNGN